jgi:integral membrane protein (TIGR01906 family)
MSAAKKGLQRGITFVITLLVPFIILMGTVRGLMTRLFLNVEYNLPGFPVDSYGFTTQDRLHWAGLTFDYAWSDEGISFLQNLRFQDGTPIYNERELSHMVDVQRLAHTMFQLWILGLGFLIIIGILTWRLKWWTSFRWGLSYGGWFMVGIVITVLIGVATSFNWLFTEFHRIFFQGNSWLFLYSDTLIRLFPIRFWTDVFIMIGVVCLVIGGLLGYFARSKYS